MISLLTLLVYVGVAYTFLFKSDMLIRKLRLMENFPEHTIPLNIHRSTVITIAIMIVALLLITQAIPLLIRGLTKWYQYNRLARGIFRETETFDYSVVLMYIGQIVIGFLLIGYHRQFANYIELQSRRKNN